jgi:hypothetical protein
MLIIATKTLAIIWPRLPAPARCRIAGAWHRRHRSKITSRTTFFL